MNAPTQNELDSHYGYIYRIVGPGGRQYIGKHTHTPSEPWTAYMGSGTLLKDEMRLLERSAFQNPAETKLTLLRKDPQAVLRYYRKHLVGFVDDPAAMDATETHVIDSLVASGKPFYNIEGVYPVGYETLRDHLAFRLSFDKKTLENLPSNLAALTDPYPYLMTDAFTMQLDAIRLGWAIRSARWDFHTRPRHGLTF